VNVRQRLVKSVLVIGGSGFIGGRLVKALLADGFAVRCLVRDSRRANDLAAFGCEIVEGDITDLFAVQAAMESMHAVYISIHTFSPQIRTAGRLRFMDVEKLGLQNVVTACRACGVRRAVYVTSLGISPDAKSEWLRERWHLEQSLLNSGLDATVIRPGFVVGVGGRGFDTVVSNAKRRVAVSMGGDRPRMRTIAIDDLVYQLVGVLDEPRAYGQCFDVGNDDVLSINELTDITADVLGRRHPLKTRAPLGLMGACAPIIERVAKMSAGAIKGLVEGLTVDSIGDPTPIRTILPRPLLSFREAVEKALHV
jgi:nucleoside-diphosphate-sugar epimerase